MRSNTTTPTADKLRRASGRSAGEPDENRPSSARGTRARLSGRSVRRRRCQFPVAADHAVDVAVTPLAIPETSAADTPFALQPDTLKCSLFRDVVDGRTGPDAVARGRREEIVDEQTLRRGACAAPAVLGGQSKRRTPTRQALDDRSGANRPTPQTSRRPRPQRRGSTDHPANGARPT